MNRDHAEALSRVLAAFSAGGDESAAAFDDLDPEGEYQDYVGVPDAVWHHGHQGALEWAAKLYSVFGQVQLTPHNFLEAPDGRLVFDADAEARGKFSGAVSRLTVHGIASFRNGKVSRVATFMTRAEALEAAGLRD